MSCNHEQLRGRSEWTEFRSSRRQARGMLAAGGPVPSRRHPAGGAFLTVFRATPFVVAAVVLALVRPPGSPSQVQAPGAPWYYRTSTCVVELPEEELRKACPFLKDVRFAPDQAGLAPLLQRTGRTVETFFRDFTNASASESVERETVIMGSRRSSVNHSRYMYLMLARPDGDGGGFEEYRTDNKGRPIGDAELDEKGLLTLGFATHSIYFHPRFQPDCRFRLVGTTRHAPALDVVAFAEVPEVSRASIAVTTEAGESRLYVQGFAWIEPQSGQITRMRSELYAARSDAGLKEQTTEIWFHEVRLGARPIWLLREVKVRLRRAGVMFENTHRYSDYHLFSVETREEVKKPQTRPPSP